MIWKYFTRFGDRLRWFFKWQIEHYTEHPHTDPLAPLLRGWLDDIFAWSINITLAGVVTNLTFSFLFGATFTYYSWLLWGLSAWWLKHAIILLVSTVRQEWR